MRKLLMPLMAAVLLAAVVGGVNFITDSAMQLDFLPSCEKISTDGSGSFLCNPDNDTTYNVFYPYIYLNSTTFGINTSAVQRRVSGTCGAGNSIRAIAVDGSVTCEVDSTGDNNYLTAGAVYTNGVSQVMDLSRTGLANITVSWTDVDTGSTDTNETPRVTAINSYRGNLSGTDCGAGQKVTGVAASGDLVCDADNDTDTTYSDLSEFADGGNIYEEEAHCTEHDGAYLSCSGEELDVDASGICDYCGFSDTTLSQEEVEDYAGGMVSGNTETWITVTYEDGDGTIDYVVDQGGICSECGFSDTVRSVEFLADAVGNMTTGNTETGITVTYQDGDNTLDFVVTDSYVNTAGDTMTGDLNMSSQNVTTVDCIRFANGATICGV